MRGSTFRFSFFVDIYGCFVYFAFPRRALCVNGHPRGTPPGTPTERCGAENWGNTNRVRNFADSWIGLLFFFLRRPSAAVSSICRRCVGRWSLMATPEERPPEPHGTPRSGKIWELRIESGILRIPGSSFRFSVCVTHPRWFRFFRISVLGVGWC